MTKEQKEDIEDLIFDLMSRHCLDSRMEEEARETIKKEKIAKKIEEIFFI